MAELLFLLMVATIAIIINHFSFEICSPSFLYSSGFLLSSLFFLISAKRWNIQIQGYTVWLIVSSCLIMYFGDVLGRVIANKKKPYYDCFTRKAPVIKSYYNIRIIRNIYIMTCICGILLRIIDIRNITGSFNLSNIVFLQAYRGASSNLSYAFKLITPFVYALFCIVLFNSIKLNMIDRKNKLSLINHIPFILYFALSSSRIEIIYIFIIILIIFLTWYRAINSITFDSRMFKIIIFSIISIGVLFWLLGFLTGKTQKQTSFLDNISLYAGSSIPALDHYLSNPTFMTNDGKSETLFGFANILELFGIQVGNIAGRNKEFIILGNMTHQTNVYTCIRALVHDYGFIGMYMFTFIQGFVLSVYYQCAKKKLIFGNDSSMCIYTYIMAIMTLSSISERFFSSILVLTTFVFCFFVKAVWATNKKYIYKY